MSGVVDLPVELEVEGKENQLKAFLKKLSLEDKFKNFQSNGLSQIEHLQDIHEKDIDMLGLTVFEWRRLQREITTWRSEEESAKIGNAKTSVAAFKTSSASTVISLPNSLSNFFGTRDGQGNIVVSIESLKRKYKALWYENPVNPTQIFSNSFILQMAEQRMQFEKTLRSCELWCRKQRSTRIYFLLALAKTPVISTWNQYYKSQSIMGKCEILERQHPAVASFLENRVREESSNVPSKAMYENICQYVAKLEEVSTFSTNALQKCDTEMAKCSPAGVLKKGTVVSTFQKR